jgi:hypothetical protein
MDESLHAKEHPMLKRLIMALAGAVLAGGLAVTVAQARGGGGFGGGRGAPSKRNAAIARRSTVKLEALS